MVTDGKYTYGEHFIMYIIVKILYCTPETNIMWCINYTSLKKNKVNCLKTFLNAVNFNLKKNG